MGEIAGLELAYVSEGGLAVLLVQSVEVISYIDFFRRYFYVLIHVCP